MFDQTLALPVLPLVLAQDGPRVPGGGTAQPTAQSAPTGTADQQTSTGAPGTLPAGGGSPAPSPFGSGFTLFPVLAVVVVMILITTMSGRKERKRRAELLSGVSRNDKVQTVGGVIGTVVELTETEMLLRVDEASNTRVRFARSALQQILKPSRDKSAATTDVEVKPALTTRV